MKDIFKDWKWDKENNDTASLFSLFFVIFVSRSIADRRKPSFPEIKSALGKDAGHTIPLRQKTPSFFPKTTPHCQRKGEGNFLNKIRLFLPQYLPSGCLPSSFRKANGLLDTPIVVSYILNQVGRLTVKNITNLIQCLYWQMLNSSQADGRDCRRPDACFFC